MTTEADIFRRAGAVPERDEQARQAVLEGRKLLPTLNAYVRAMTGRTDLIVEMATRDNGSTSGSRIYWRPPMALGDKTPHARLSCNKRDNKGQLICAACAKREDVLVIIYHEIAHNVFGSFQEVSDKDKLELMKKAIESTGGAWAKQIRARIEKAPDWTKSSYIGMCGLINEYLPLILNALEDARVNREMFKARKGLRPMFDAQVQRVFTAGVEQLDNLGKVVTILWRDYPLNTQVIVGLFAKTSGYDFKGWFQPSVERALEDEELTRILSGLETIRSAAGVYHLSFPVLARLRELGFCALPDDPNPEPEPQPEGESEDDPSDDTSDEPCDDSGGEDDSEESGDTDGGAGASEEPDPAGSEDPGGDDSEDSSDEAGSAGGDGKDPDEAKSDPGSGTGTDGSGGDGEPSADPEDDSSSDESDGAPGMGEPGLSEDVDGEGSEESEPDGTPSGGSDDPAGSDSTGGSDSDVPQETAESNPGTGEISGSDERGEADEPVDGEENTGGGSGESASDAGSDSGSDASESDDSSGDDADRGDEAEYASTDSDGSSEGDAPRSDEGDGVDAEDAEGDLPGEGSSGGTDPTSGDESSSDRDGRGGDIVGDEAHLPSDSGSEDDRGSDSDREADRERDRESGPGLEDEPIDTGADRGLGGTEVVENPENDDKDLPEGTPEEARVALLKLGDHEEPPKKLHEEERDEEAIDRAIIQGIYFETPSRHIFGVREHRFGQPIYIDGQNMSQAWQHDAWYYAGMSKDQLGVDGDFEPPESILGGALVRMRVTFSDNQRGKTQGDLKAGKVNPRVLGKRAWNGDERLFRKRTAPGKKSYFVLLGMDVSGSTLGRNIALEKRAVMAQAELCHRMGIKFAIMAHSGNYHKPRGSRADGLDLDIYIVKEPNQPWNDEVKIALRDIGPDNANLDGHTLEYYRKFIERRPETDKIIMYYTDGKMPAENHDEELVILQREIKACNRRRITLMGVGIRTDSPIRHGLDTVQVDEDEDIVKVVRHLEKRLRAMSEGRIV